MSETYTDTTGQQFRKQGDQWQILQTGLGWREFVGKTYIIDVGMVDTTVPEHDKTTEDAQVQASRENDLFIHFAGIALGGICANSGYEPTEHTHFCYAAVDSCEQAQAMIDELKERGKL